MEPETEPETESEKEPSRPIIRATISVLEASNSVAHYAMAVMITYLSGVWELSVTHAAGIVNLYSGIVGIIPIATQIIVHSFMGDYWMLVVSSLAYTAGFLLLTMSTPPVLAGATGTCSSYEADCIGQVQKILFYTALSLIGVGVCGYSVSLEKFGNANALPARPPSDPFTCKMIFLTAAVILTPIAAIISLDYISIWSVKFGIPAIFLVVGTLIFLLGSRSYDRTRNHELRYTLEAEEIGGMLCMITLCLSFIIAGVVSAIGNTYFMQTASTMYGKILGIPTTVLFFPYMYSTVRSGIKSCGNICSPQKGILCSMVFAVLCCISAATVETFRLSVAKSHGLIDLPDETVPMSRFWLIPQYVFLAAADGLLEKGIVRFYTLLVLDRPMNTDLEQLILPEEKPDPSDSPYINLFAKAISGLGAIFSVLLVHVVGKIKPTWFQDTLNTSRFDNYYWTLAAFTAANVLVTGCIFSCIGRG